MVWMSRDACPIPDGATNQKSQSPKKREFAESWRTKLAVCVTGNLEQLFTSSPESLITRVESGARHHAMPNAVPEQSAKSRG